MRASFRTGDTVYVPSEGQYAVIQEIHPEGDLTLVFSDGGEGNYSADEVEQDT